MIIECGTARRAAIAARAGMFEIGAPLRLEVLINPLL